MRRVSMKPVARAQFSKREIDSMLEEAKEIQAYLLGLRDRYKRLDEITEDLLFACEEIEGLDDYMKRNGVALVDKFAERNTTWKSTPQRRWELQILEAALYKYLRTEDEEADDEDEEDAPVVPIVVPAATRKKAAPLPKKKAPLKKSKPRKGRGENAEWQFETKKTRRK